MLIFCHDVDMHAFNMFFNILVVDLDHFAVVVTVAAVVGIVC